MPHTKNPSALQKKTHLKKSLLDLLEKLLKLFQSCMHPPPGAYCSKETTYRDDNNFIEHFARLVQVTLEQKKNNHLTLLI